MTQRWLGIVFFWLSMGMLCAAERGAEVTPLMRAHAHNDYEHGRPLLDALEQGFGSVEADVYLVDGSLLVAHYRDQVKEGRDLETLYLAPLAERVKKYGGSVYPGSVG